MTRFVLSVPLEALAFDGVSLPDWLSVASGDLAGARIVSPDPSQAMLRLEQVNRFATAVSSMSWRHAERVCSGVLADGRNVVLLLSGVSGPVMEVLAMPVVFPGSGAVRAEFAVFSALFGQAVAAQVASGQVCVSDGDLAWLDSRLNPASAGYVNRR
jgi:hypothetical protein